MADLESAIDYLMGTLIAAVPGIKQAPQKPVESTPEFPLALAIPVNGRITTHSYSQSEQLAVVRLAVHVPRTMGINQAVDTALPLIDSISDVLINPANATLNGTIDTIVTDDTTPITWTFAPSGFADVETFAWFFDMTLKYHRTIS